MKNFFLKIYDFLSGHKWFASGILVIILAVCIFLVSRLQFSEDISEFLPGDDLSRKYMSVYANSNSQDKIAIIFSPDNDSVPLDTVVYAMDCFKEIFSKNDTDSLVADFEVKVDEMAMLETMGFVTANYPYFLTDADYLRMDSLLQESDYIESQLEADKQMLMFPAAGVMVGNLRYDPLNLFSPVLQRMKSFQMSEGYTIIDGCIFIKDTRQGLAFMSSPFGASESSDNEVLAALIDKSASETEAKVSSVKVSSVGAPLIAVTNSRQIKRDSMVSMLLSLVLILALLLLSFRRFRDLLWIMVSIAVGWLIALGAFALLGSSMSLIVIGVGSIMIGIAVNYPLHFLDRFKVTNNVRETLGDVVEPLVIGNITTVGAFACLLWLDAAAIRQMGLFGSLVLIGTILFVIIFLPVFMKPRKKAFVEHHGKIESLLSMKMERKKWVAGVVVIITLVLGWFSTDISFDSDLHHINYMTDEQERDLKILSESLGQDDAGRIYAVSEANDLQSALAQNECMLDSLTGRKSSNYEIKYVSGIGNFIPTEARQTERLSAWRNFWTKHDSTLIDFKGKSMAAGFSEGAFEPFIESVGNEYKVMPVDYFNPILELVGMSYVQNTGSGVRILNHIGVDGDGKKLKEELRTSVSGSMFFDTEDVSGRLVSALSDDFNFVGFVCSFIVFFFLWLSFGRIELSLMSFLPLAVSWVWILGAMQLLGVQFNIVNIILATFIFGQGDDYTIFITEGLMSEYAKGKKVLMSYKKSVALSSVIMFVGIGSLVIASHPAMRSLGVVTVIGMITVVIMAFYLPPLVFRWLTTKKGRLRELPVTLLRLLQSFLAISIFGIFALFVIKPIAFLMLNFGADKEKRKKRIHKLICFSTKFTIKHVPGAKFRLNNISGEKFDRPAMIICNHQSFYDLMCILSLSPKIVVMANDKAWNSPVFGSIIRNADFYPASDGYEKHLTHLQALVDQGYLIAVFPEGTRSEDRTIMRFHKGAFYLAEKLNLDILPVFVHGVGHVLPKREFMICRGRMYMEIHNRISINDPKIGSDYRQKTSYFHKYYVENYAELLKMEETMGNYKYFVRHKYLYKGKDVERRCRRVLANVNMPQLVLDKSVHVIWVLNSGQGEVAWLFALMHHGVDVYAFEKNEDDYALASHCSFIPRNLHFMRYESKDDFANVPQADICFALCGEEGDVVADYGELENVKNINLFHNYVR